MDQRLVHRLAKERGLPGIDDGQDVFEMGHTTIAPTPLHTSRAGAPAGYDTSEPPPPFVGDANAFARFIGAQQPASSHDLDETLRAVTDPALVQEMYARAVASPRAASPRTAPPAQQPPCSVGGRRGRELLRLEARVAALESQVGVDVQPLRVDRAPELPLSNSLDKAQQMMGEFVLAAGEVNHKDADRVCKGLSDLKPSMDKIHELLAEFRKVNNMGCRLQVDRLHSLFSGFDTCAGQLPSVRDRLAELKAVSEDAVSCQRLVAEAQPPADWDARLRTAEAGLSELAEQVGSTSHAAVVADVAGMMHGLQQKIAAAVRASADAATGGGDAEPLPVPEPFIMYRKKGEK